MQDININGYTPDIYNMMVDNINKIKDLFKNVIQSNKSIGNMLIELKDNFHMQTGSAIMKEYGNLWDKWDNMNDNFTKYSQYIDYTEYQNEKFYQYNYNNEFLPNKNINEFESTCIKIITPIKKDSLLYAKEATMFFDKSKALVEKIKSNISSISDDCSQLEASNNNIVNTCATALNDTLASKIDNYYNNIRLKINEALNEINIIEQTINDQFIELENYISETVNSTDYRY